MEDDASKSDPVAPQDIPQTPNRPKPKRVNTDETERPASAQQERDGSDYHAGSEQNASDDDEEPDPATPIADFDWNDLHQRYHDAISNCSREEDELMQEWTNLMEVLLCYFARNMKVNLTKLSSSAFGRTQGMSTKRIARSEGV